MTGESRIANLIDEFWESRADLEGGVPPAPEHIVAVNVMEYKTLMETANDPVDQATWDMELSLAAGRPG